MDKEQLTGIVFLARKFHWSREEIGKLSPAQFQSLLTELTFQEQQEEYQRNYRVATVLATIINCTPRKETRRYKATDFIGNPPQREESVSPMQLAKDKGLKIPLNGEP